MHHIDAELLRDGQEDRHKDDLYDGRIDEHAQNQDGDVDDKQKDVFVRGQGNRLYHKWWDGSNWSDFEDLGGNIASAPAVSSRATNRLEVFARNSNNQLITRSWNGSRWSKWQTIGGTFTLDPAAVSWGTRRTDVFVRGANNALWHIWRD